MIILNPKVFNMSSPSGLHKPFPCGNRSELSDPEHIGGISFDIHEKTSTNVSHCIWAGPTEKCSFNALVEFVSEQSKNGYRFAVSALLVDLPWRRCYHHVSAPIWEDSVVIVGRKDAIFSETNSIQMLIRPFRTDAWIVFIVTGFMLLLCSIIIKYKYKISWVRYIQMFLMDDFDNDELRNSLQHRTFNELVMVCVLLRRAGKVLLAIFLLFYAAAVVNFLFEEVLKELPKSLSKWSYRELKKFAILQDSALEDVFKIIGKVSKLHFQKVVLY